MHFVVFFNWFLNEYDDLSLDATVVTWSHTPVWNIDTMWVNVSVRQSADSAYDAVDAALAVVENMPQRSPVIVLSFSHAMEFRWCSGEANYRRAALWHHAPPAMGIHQLTPLADCRTFSYRQKIPVVITTHIDQLLCDFMTLIVLRCWHVLKSLNSSCQVYLQLI